MTAYQRDQRNESGGYYGFAIGLLAGTCVGAGLALWFAPRLAAELRERATDTAKDIGRRVADGYQRVTSPIATAAADVAEKSQEVRDDVADVVAHGARAVERFATAAKTRL